MLKSSPLSTHAWPEPFVLGLAEANGRNLFERCALRAVVLLDAHHHEFAHIAALTKLALALR
jgi:hypothetical protein